MDDTAIQQEGNAHGRLLCGGPDGPQRVRKNYMLYDNKLSSPDPTSVILGRLRDSLSGIGYKITVGRGDYHKETRL